MFTVCRVVAWILCKVRIFEEGPGGTDYHAIPLYRHINPERAEKLAEEMFPSLD